MSIINATLVAQAIHFLIAYLLIKYLFFKPVFEQIEQEDTLQESLINTIQSQQNIVAQKEQDLITQWHALKNYFATHVALVPSVSFGAHKRTQVQLPQLESQDINKAITQLTKEIVKKVKHVQ